METRLRPSPAAVATVAPHRAWPTLLSGLALVAFGELTMLAGWEEAARWVTPLCWWGYILVLDGLIVRKEGVSPIRDRPGAFLRDSLLSIPFWVIFEVYNLHLRNWEYHGLPELLPVRLLGFALAFASIGPGMLLTYRLIAAHGLFARLSGPRYRFPPGGVVLIGFAGALFLIVPLLLPWQVAHWLFALVWLGFVFLLDPILYRSGGPSLLGDLEEGRIDRLLGLFLAGFLCGFLWEFWNYWAQARWVYTLPFTPDVRVFEMPLAGFLGFGPFAVEFYLLYAAAALVGRRPRAHSPLLGPSSRG